MSKEEIIDYVMNSPANTNPNVLSGMLDGISGTQLPSPTESDNGKVLGVDGGEYKLMDKEPSVEEVIFNGAYAYKVGKIAYVSYAGSGIVFPPMGQGGLTVQSGSLEVADIAVGGSKILAYVRGTDATKRYGVVAGNNNGKAQLYLIDATNMAPVSETVTIWDNFCIPCK